MGDASFEIESHSLLAGSKAFGETGAYEQLKGTIHLAVDPEKPRNEVITDLKLAPRDAEGLVRCSADFSCVKTRRSKEWQSQNLLRCVEPRQQPGFEVLQSRATRIEPPRATRAR